MKSIIIAWAARSGKSKLARRLQKETGFSLISGDALICSFAYAYPQLGITLEEDIEKVAFLFEPFLIDYIEHLRLYQNIPYILDTVNLMPEQIIKHRLHEKCNVLFMGHPHVERHEKLGNIRIYKTEFFDWTTDETDEQLLDKIDLGISWSQKMQRECLLHGLSFIDTGLDFKAAQEKAYSLAIVN